MPDQRLPRLLYLADVPVEATFHGSALIYRLLQRYPVEQLRIIEGNLFPPASDRRLPYVEYTTFTVGLRRLLHSRFHAPYSAWLFSRGRSRATSVARHLQTFAPQAVLTVAHGYSWVTAARFAQEHDLPLHLIVHDDWPRIARHGRVEEEFARVYRQAASRLCVSPLMAQEYEERYGAAGTVLLPSRAVDAITFDRPVERRQIRSGGPVFAFAGTINSPGYVKLLGSLARQLAVQQGWLKIFGPLSSAQAAAAGLTDANIRLEGLMAPAELLHRLRADADVLFVPMSFATEDRANMRLSFPSKLTDYTSVGLPMLICGPADCSAVRWAQTNPGVAEVVASEDSAALADSIGRLCRDGELRIALARTALKVGKRDFSAEAAEATFHAALVA